MSVPDFLPPISALPAFEATAAAALTRTPASDVNAVPKGDFGQLVIHGLEQVNGSLLDAQVGTQRLAAGEADNLHQLMLKLEESRLSFQLMLQIRNRLLESYQDVMRMQV